MDFSSGFSVLTSVWDTQEEAREREKRERLEKERERLERDKEIGER